MTASPFAEIEDRLRRDARHEAARQRAIGHSRRVRLLKIGLPIAAVALTLGFAGYAWLGIEPATSVSLDGIAISDGKIAMSNPSMDGMTENNLPFSVTARQALQTVGKENEVELQDITAKLPLSASLYADLVATGGLLDNSRKTLALKNGLTLTAQNGMVATLTSADIDISAGNLQSTDPVDIRRDGTHITADSLQLRDGGRIIIFEKRVRVTIEPATLQTPFAGDAASGN